MPDLRTLRFAIGLVQQMCIENGHEDRGKSWGLEPDDLKGKLPAFLPDVHTAKTWWIIWER